MPVWGWVALTLGVGWLLFGAGSGNTYPASTSQGDVRARTPEDWRTLWDVANRLGSTPQILGIILFGESGMDPGASNPAGCYGANQFCKSGGTYDAWVHVPPDEYVTWSLAQQLRGPIGNFWASKPASSLQSARGLYWVNFLPASYVANASPDTLVNDPAVMGQANAIAYAHANPAISQGRDWITAGDLDNYIAALEQAPGWQYALQQIAANEPSGDNA